EDVLAERADLLTDPVGHVPAEPVLHVAEQPEQTAHQRGQRQRSPESRFRGFGEEVAVPRLLQRAPDEPAYAIAARGPLVSLILLALCRHSGSSMLHSSHFGSVTFSACPPRPLGGGARYARRAPSR